MQNYSIESAVIVPCYKEEKRLNTTQYIEELKSFTSKVILVDDGSPDNTFGILKQLEQQAPERFVVIKNSKNSGKAEAIRTGMLYATENYPDLKYIGFLDADLAVKFSEIPDFLKIFKDNPEINTVIGVRSKLAGHRIQRSNLQYFMQRIIAGMGSFLFTPKVIDTQCGAKFFDINVLKSVIQEPFVSKWLFDQELLTRVSKLPESTNKNWLYEHPVSSWTEIGNSHRKTSDYLNCLEDYFKILKKYGFGKKF